MLPRATVRGWQLDQMRKSLSMMHTLLQRVTPQEVRTYRDGGTGWTVLEVACHLRDYETIFYERVASTVEQDAPPLVNPNPDALASEHRYNEQDLQQVIHEWTEARTALLTYLAGLSESDWQRAGVHPRRGKMSLEDQLTLMAWHDVNHFEQITRILAERKTT